MSEILTVSKSLQNESTLKENNKNTAKIIIDQQSQQKEKDKPKIILNTREVRYDVIKKIARHTFGWKITKCRKPGDDWDLLWTDDVFSAEKLQGMKPYQMINHFPGMYLIALKHNLGKYLKIMQKAFPDHYNFFPKTWITPYEFYDLYNYIGQKKKPITMIVKPQNQCQGKGIFITRKVDDIPKDKCQVVQQYQTQPLLIDNKKFDLRIYVLVTQVEPNLTCFIYKDGLARFATDEYNSQPVNNSNLFMHLTNYAINKNSEKFTENEDEYKKRLVDIYQYLEKEGHDVNKLQDQIKDIVIKTLMSIQPQLGHMYKACTPNHAEFRSCFELLGFDILLDKKLKPYLLEVNHAPSFNDDTEVDKIVKTNLITDTFRLLDIRYSNKQRIINNEKKEVMKRDQFKDALKQIQQVDDKVNEQQQRMDNLQKKYEDFQSNNQGLYEKIYPLSLKNEEDKSRNELYEQIKAHAYEIWYSQTGAKKNQNQIVKKEEVKKPEIKSKRTMSMKKDIQQNAYQPKPIRRPTNPTLQSSDISTTNTSIKDCKSALIISDKKMGDSDDDSSAAVYQQIKQQKQEAIQDDLRDNRKYPSSNPLRGNSHLQRKNQIFTQQRTLQPSMVFLDPFGANPNSTNGSQYEHLSSNKEVTLPYIKNPSYKSSQLNMQLENTKLPKRPSLRQQQQQKQQQQVFEYQQQPSNLTGNKFEQYLAENDQAFANKLQNRQVASEGPYKGKKILQMKSGIIDM